MKRATIIIFVVFCIAMLAGCDDSFYTITYPEPVIVQPNAETAYTINGYRQKFPSVSSQATDNAESEQVTSVPESDENVLYYGNKSTKKFHLQTCRYAKNMDKEKLLVFSSYDDAVDMGYSPCKICQKQE